MPYKVISLVIGYALQIIIIIQGCHGNKIIVGPTSNRQNNHIVYIEYNTAGIT